MDKMTRAQLREFQRAYLEGKIDIENGIDGYVTDRSFVDVAAYWLVRDAFDLPEMERDAFVERCRVNALRYDYHFHLPMGVLEFESDGYRSENQEFHWAIEQEIRRLLKLWRISYITVSEREIAARVLAVKRTIGDKING
jgi:hypothetical protein